MLDSKKCAVARFQMKGIGKLGTGVKTVWCGTRAKPSSTTEGTRVSRSDSTSTRPPMAFEGDTGALPAGDSTCD